jgi:hypothetical protein
MWQISFTWFRSDEDVDHKDNDVDKDDNDDDDVNDDAKNDNAAIYLLRTTICLWTRRTSVRFHREPTKLLSTYLAVTFEDTMLQFIAYRTEISTMIGRRGMLCGAVSSREWGVVPSLCNAVQVVWYCVDLASYLSRNAELTAVQQQCDNSVTTVLQQCDLSVTTV